MAGMLLVGAAYLLVAVFVIAFVVRTSKLAALPVHLRWELAPIPHEKGKGQYGGSYFEELDWWTKPREKSFTAELIYMFWEIAFLRGILERNRRLWWFSFPFHMGLYLLIAATPFLALSLVVTAIGSQAAWADKFVLTLAVAGYILGGLGALGLLLSRAIDPRLRSMTTPESIFNLVLLLLLFGSGGYAAAMTSGFVPALAGFAEAFFTADFTVIVPATVAIHVGLALVFLAYLPFTPMMHFVAKYFTYHQVRWDDEPLVPGGPVEKEVIELLGQKVTWASAHIGADGTKNWVDIATEDTRS